MEMYQKPVVLLNEELAEGVYAASGAVDAGGSTTGGAGGARVSKIELTSAGNEYYKVNGYTVTISNDGSEELTDWSVTLTVIGTATSLTNYDSQNFKVTLDGNTITITPIQYGSIAPGGTKSVGFAVSYSSPAITLE